MAYHKYEGEGEEASTGRVCPGRSVRGSSFFPGRSERVSSRGWSSRGGWVGSAAGRGRRGGPPLVADENLKQLGERGDENLR